MYKTGFLIVLILIPLLTGCSAVYSTDPIGNEPVKLKPADWQGSWLHPEGTITIEILDAEKGLLRAAWIENMELKSFDVHLLSSNDWMFGSTKDKPNDPHYIWGRVKHQDNQLIVWSPDVAKFKSLVKEGSLPGTLDDGGDVILGELTADQLSLITSEKNGVPFNWDEPLVLIRLSQ